MSDLILDRAVKVAEIESTIATVWLDAYEAGDVQFARDSYFVGLQAEHYLSFIPLEPTDDQSATLKGLLDKYNAVIHEAGLRRGKRYGG